MKLNQRCYITCQKLQCIQAALKIAIISSESGLQHNFLKFIIAANQSR